jgi:hypothetical protein
MIDSLGRPARAALHRTALDDAIDDVTSRSRMDWRRIGPASMTARRLESLARSHHMNSENFDSF